MRNILCAVSRIQFNVLRIGGTKRRKGKRLRRSNFHIVTLFTEHNVYTIKLSRRTKYYAIIIVTGRW